MPTGELYGRKANIEGLLRELLTLPDETLLERCSSPLHDLPGYVPNECLTYLVRTKYAQTSPTGKRLFGILVERVLNRLPARENFDHRGISLTGSNIADEALDQFLELLHRDQNEYDERLDFYEVSFVGAIRTLKLDAEKKIWRREKRSVPVVEDEETGELPPKMEEAVGLAEGFGAAQLQRAEFRARLGPAIKLLPAMQQRILEMLRLDFPIDSKDPNVMTIAKALGACEKTIRNQRDQAFNTLKDFLNGDKLS